MFFCSLGKDRTGIISALLLSCLGVDRNEIIENFHFSEKLLEPNMECIKKYFNKIGLSKDEFVKAPKLVMKQLLDYIDRIYGSVPDYLYSIGLTFEEQKLIFHLVTTATDNDAPGTSELRNQFAV